MLEVECCRFDGGSWNYFFVCAILLRWVPIFLRAVYSAQFCLQQCRSRPRLSYVFEILSVDWYVRNRIWHVHPVSDDNSRCRLGAARHSTNVSCLAGPVCISSYRPTQDERARILWRHQMEIFPRYWSFVRWIHRSPVNSSHKGQWRGALMLSLICARINGWVNNREVVDFRRYRTHYDVIVM